MIRKVCVAGAGTMGSGIAFVCARQGFETLLFDVNTTMLEKAQHKISADVQMLIAKEKISAEIGSNLLSAIKFTSNINDCIADIFIEAIIENLEAKISLFAQLASINSPDVLFATNTSALPVTSIQQTITPPHRLCGIHFFNPAPVMKLVEVIAGEKTSQDTLDIVQQFCRDLGKTPVPCKDSPGFIVNRVARHYYLEAMKIAEQEHASIEDIDAIMEASGFKMGPFKLMDLIGIDINLSVTESLYESFRHERFKPAALQVDKVKKGALGKKSGKGFYDYTGN